MFLPTCIYRVFSRRTHRTFLLIISTSSGTHLFCPIGLQSHQLLQRASLIGLTTAHWLHFWVTELSDDVGSMCHCKRWCSSVLLLHVAAAAPPAVGSRVWFMCTELLIKCLAFVASSSSSRRSGSGSRIQSGSHQELCVERVIRSRKSAGGGGVRLQSCPVEQLLECIVALSLLIGHCSCNSLSPTPSLSLHLSPTCCS